LEEVEAVWEDIATADRLIDRMVNGREGFQFSRRWGPTQVRVHLDRLQGMEYLATGKRLIRSARPVA
jgi:hypothetical protein